MPLAALHACGKPGCRALLRRGTRYCDRHRRESHKQIDERRGSSFERGYDAAWRRLRVEHLRLNPTCLSCSERGLLAPATVVDHIVPISQAPERRLDPTNLRSMCKPCHDRRTATEQGFARRGRGGAKVGRHS